MPPPDTIPPNLRKPKFNKPAAAAAAITEGTVDKIMSWEYSQILKSSQTEKIEVRCQKVL